MDGAAFDRAFVGPMGVIDGVWLDESRLSQVHDASRLAFFAPGLHRGSDAATHACLSQVGYLQVSWQGFADYGAGIGGYAATVVPVEMVGVLANATAAYDGTQAVAEILNVTAGLLGVEAGGVGGWIEAGLGSSAAVLATVESGVEYATVVLAWDALGNAGLCSSDEFVFDATPPNVTAATLENLLGTADSIELVQAETNMLYMQLDGIEDPESGVQLTVPATSPDATAANDLLSLRVVTSSVLLTTVLPEGEAP